MYEIKIKYQDVDMLASLCSKLRDEHCEFQAYVRGNEWVIEIAAPVVTK